MKIGVVFPQTEIGTDPLAIRDYAQAIEAAGFDYLVAYDHVLGSPNERYAGANIGYSQVPYTDQSQFHEVFVLFGYLAAFTQRIELATGVLILPQRQTALVAKQAAAVDVLCGGRLRLGVGTGWNFVEYEALNEDFHTRGRRLEEQVELMRKLWTEPLVSFEGRWHRFQEAAINPLPVQRPIPIWMGGSAEVVLKRMARMADGWFVGGSSAPPHEVDAQIERLRGYLRAEGRDPASFGLDVRARPTDGGPDEWARFARAKREAGMTHIGLNTMKAGSTSPQQHIDTTLRWLEAVREA
jgi:probable F420-dependent oxidoreductase